MNKSIRLILLVMIPHAIILPGRGDKLHRKPSNAIQRVRKSTVHQDRTHYERRQAVWYHKVQSKDRKIRDQLTQSIQQQLQQLSLNNQPQRKSSCASI